MTINRLVLYVAQMTFEVKLWLCDTILSGMNPWIAKLGHKIALILSHWRGVSGARLVELYKFIVYFSCIYHTLRWAAWVEMLTLYVLCKSVTQSSLEPTKSRTVKINSKKNSFDNHISYTTLNVPCMFSSLSMLWSSSACIFSISLSLSMSTCTFVRGKCDTGVQPGLLTSTSLQLDDKKGHILITELVKCKNAMFVCLNGLSMAVYNETSNCLQIMTLYKKNINDCKKWIKQK